MPFFYCTPYLAPPPFFAPLALHPPYALHPLLCTAWSFQKTKSLNSTQKMKKSEIHGNSLFIREKMLTIFGWNFEIEERCKGVHCVDLGESFPTSIYLQKSASIQPRTSPSKFGGKFNSLFTSLLSGFNDNVLCSQQKHVRSGRKKKVACVEVESTTGYNLSQWPMNERCLMVIQ